MNNPWHLYVMSGLYCVAGLMHFIKPKAFMRVMPRYLPNHRLLVYLSGVAEIVCGGALLMPSLKVYAVYGILIMLTLFLAVHFYMLSGKKASAGFPKWLLIIRVPIQFLLMYWAYTYIQ